MGVDFDEGGKPEYPVKKPWSTIEIDKSQPTHEHMQEIRTGARRGGSVSHGHSYSLCIITLNYKTPYGFRCTFFSFLLYRGLFMRSFSKIIAV